MASDLGVRELQLEGGLGLTRSWRALASVIDRLELEVGGIAPLSGWVCNP